MEEKLVHGFYLGVLKDNLANEDGIPIVVAYVKEELGDDGIRRFYLDSCSGPGGHISYSHPGREMEEELITWRLLYAL